MGFEDLSLIIDGEPVEAGVANRPLLELLSKHRYLWDLIKSAASGSTVFARRVSVDDDVLVGQPVYWHAGRQQFEQSLASANTGSSGQPETSDSSNVWGVVYTKHNATLADILLLGYATLDITAALATGQTLAAGNWYLSGTTAGKLTRTRPAVAIPVLKADGAGKVFVSPQWIDLLTAHTHLSFDLACQPAGDTEPPSGGRHTITNPDVSQRGWLPAGHASFGGHAPAAAAFGYNLAADAGLNTAWPPLPASNAALEWDNGVDPAQGFHRVPSGLPDGLVVFDRYGIWWMSDCEGDAPWPTDLDTAIPTSESASESQTVPECPRRLDMAMKLSFTKPAFLSETTVVTSLSTDDERISITCDGEDATVGPLNIALNLEFLSDDSADPAGFRALMEWDPDAETFHRGLIATGLYTANDNVALTGEATSTRTIGGTPRTIHHGAVRVDVDTAFNREMAMGLVRVEGVTEERVEDVMYLGFPAGELASFRGRINIPYTLDLTSPKLRLRLRILGRGAGVLPQLTVTYRRVPTVALATPAALPTVDTALVIDTEATLTVANQYADFLSDPVTVAGGDDFYFTVQRAEDDDYAHELGVLRLVAVLSET